MFGKRKKILQIYPWNMSATGDWSPDIGIYKLRDDAPEQLAKDLWEYGVYVQQSAVREMAAHGNPRKAAQFVRYMVKQHPELEDTIRSQYGSLETYLFDIHLSRLPSNPDEYPQDVKIVYVQ